MVDNLIENYANSENPHSENLNNIEKKMPQNLEAEQSLLGSILFDNKILEDLPANFDSQYFFDPLHENIYKACISLTDTNRLADPLTLKNYLNDSNLNKDVDIEKYLLDLREGVLSLRKAKFYAEEIKNCYIRRSLIRIADELIYKSINPKIEVNPDEEISKTEEKLYNMAEKDQVNLGPLDFKSVLASTTNQINEAFTRKGKLSGVDTGFSGLNRQL